MTSNPLNRVAQQLRRAVLAEDSAGLTDGQLLDGFVNRRDPTALEALVRRHSPMVWGVCRRLLRHHQDAEDAYQATFLILVRKAASIRPREMVASWLYGVAHRTALNARGAAWRRALLKQLEDVPDPQLPDHDSGGEIQAVIDQELSQVPDKYRAAFILCDLEGKTRKEAASQLGLPEGTVASRLARARAILASRLALRGVVRPAGTLATALGLETALAAVPASLTSSTIQTLTLMAAGRSTSDLIRAPVAALTKGVLTAMFLTKLKMVTALLLLVVLGLVAAGAGLHSFSGVPEGAQNPAAPTGEKTGKSDKEDQRAVAPPKEEAKEDLIRPGDRLHIEALWVLPQQEIYGTYRVEPKGTVPLGVAYGRVQIKGQTLEEAEVTIRAHLRKLSKEAEVAVTRYDPLTDERYTLQERISQLEREVKSLRSGVLLPK